MLQIFKGVVSFNPIRKAKTILAFKWREFNPRT